jgi:hypothetical protein
MIKLIHFLRTFFAHKKHLVAALGSILILVSQQLSANQADSLLLYASFNEYSDKAEYANGWDSFGGGGYRLTPGYLGNAVDLRNHGLEQDFWKTENSFLPHITQWMFWPRGNVDFRQGTLEFWVSGADVPEIDLMGFHSNQPLAPIIQNGTTKHFQPFVRMSNSRLRWFFVSLKGVLIEGRVDFANIPGFKRLTVDQWSHLTFQWSPEGFSVYMDGRLISTQLLDDDGLALVSQPNRSITMGGVILDELKIWDYPRYGKTFEPEWKNGIRPAGACPGIASVNAIVSHAHIRNRPERIIKGVENLTTISLDTWQFKFDAKTGYLSALTSDNLSAENSLLAGGLLIWKGTDRNYLGTPKLLGEIKSIGGSISFQQEWPSGLNVEHTLTAGSSNEIYWDTKYINTGTAKLWIEALLGLPLATETHDFFDMSWTQDKLEYPRRRDEYVHSIPFVAASDGKKGWGLGLDPHQGVSALIGEWIPSSNIDKGFIRQGSRVVLNEGEQQTLRFVLIAFSGEFGVKDGLAAYQDLFPNLYKQRKETSKYSYMGVSQHFRHVYVPELARQYYIGNQWGHLAYHTKGDYLGRERFWGREDLKDDPSYAHAAGREKSYKTIASMRDQYVFRNKESFDSYYTGMRTHDLPNLPAAFIPREVMPGVVFSDDPLVAGQYYMPENMYVNEYNTPLGAMFKEDLKGMVGLVGKYSTGMTNDLSQLTPFRFNDEYARRSPGRAFSVDRGEYLVSAIGSMDRYKVLDSLPVNGKVRTMWSDYGGTSYTTSAYSAANAIESGEWFYSLGGLQIGLEVGRNLLGEKPMALLTSYGLDDIGSRFTVADFTPDRLRDYYRFGFRRIMLAAFQAGYYVDPPMLHGKQWNSEVNPILVESLVNGRKTVSAAKVNQPLWTLRGGNEDKDILVIGNSSTKEQLSSVEIMNQYFHQGRRYLWAPYFGGCVMQSVKGQLTQLDEVKVKAHDVAAYKPVAELIGTDATQARALWEGDGLTIKMTIQINVSSAGQLRIISPATYYTLSEVLVNGKKSIINPNQKIILPSGESRIEAILQNTVLEFNQSVWRKALLLINGQSNFCLIAGKTTYEKGTAAQINYFLQQYDEEDGIEGNLTTVPVYEDEKDIPSSFGGWRINLRTSESGTKTSVVIDSLDKKIIIKGGTPGEVRRATMLFMRLVDRTYPHIGRFVPLGINLERVWGNGKPNDPENAWKTLYDRRTKTLAFFENFPDQKFLSKPILEKNMEYLYKNDNKNFEAKYKMRRSPYLFEPTYDESFVYDYSGIE